MIIGSPIIISGSEPKSYNSWPWRNCFYDASRDKIFIAWNSSTIHDETSGGNLAVNFDREARCALKSTASSEDMGSTSNTFAASTLISSAADTVVNIHGAMIDSSNNYLCALSPHVHPAQVGTDGTLQIAKSTNGAGSWTITNTGLTGSFMLGLHQCPSGRIISIITSGITVWSAGKFNVGYSDDGGTTWTLGAQINHNLAPFSAGYFPWEPAFINLVDGRIVSLWRPKVGVETRLNLLWSISSDGINWSPLKTTNLFSSLGTPHMLRLNGKAHIVFSNRGSTTHGMYYTTASDDMLAAGDFGKPEFMFPGVATKDFGYPCLVGVGEKLWIYYYIGDGAPRVDIYERRITLT